MNAPELIATLVALIIILRGTYLTIWPDKARSIVQRIVEWPHLSKLGILCLLIGTAVFYYGTRGLSLAVKVNAFVGAAVMVSALLLAFPKGFQEITRAYFEQSNTMLRLQGSLVVLIGLLILYSLRQGL